MKNLSLLLLSIVGMAALLSFLYFYGILIQIAALLSISMGYLVIFTSLIILIVVLIDLLYYLLKKKKNTQEYGNYSIDDIEGEE